LTLEPASEHAALIATFYAAFRQRDHATMAGCYAPDAELEIAVSGIEAMRSVARPTGKRSLLLGWSPPVQNAIRRGAADGLDTFIRKNGLDRDPR
jgi:hypothetical protein